MDFEWWWVDQHGSNWKANLSDECRIEAKNAWIAATKAEREACAKVCEVADKSTHPADLADLIRSRGQTNEG
jgi:hypothetical protein